ncbi:MAG: hypothetical protein JO131_03835 [Gammaproteobacteria bacterium]|nr:hypothetical protein [Gammaproteobacteria bacterium]
MIEINLLPWRMYQEENIKNQNVKKIWYVLGVSIILWMSFYFIWMYKCKITKQAISYLQQQLTTIHLLEKQNAFTPDKSIKSLTEAFQQNQSQLIHFFNEIIDSAPQEIQWGKMLSQSQEVFVTGKINSYQNLLRFIQDAMKKGYNFELIKVKQLPETHVLEFSLRCNRILDSLPPLAENNYDI